jgi:hypothetical protein
MSKTYQIIEWNAIISHGSSPCPTVYIKYDNDLKKLWEYNNGHVNIVIKNSNSEYDDNVYYATIKPSAIIGGFRPNFQAVTDLWGIELNTEWNGYPCSKGTIEILEWVKIPKDTVVQSVPPQSSGIPFLSPGYTLTDEDILILFVIAVIIIYYYNHQ